MTRFIPVAIVAAGILRIRKCCVSSVCGWGGGHGFVRGKPLSRTKCPAMRLSFGKQPFAVHHGARFCTAKFFGRVRRRKPAS